MPQSLSSESGDGSGRLYRCIRDLAALNALPSMCVGRTLSDALEIVLDALPTVLNCDLLYLRMPGNPAKECVSLGKKRLAEPRLTEVCQAVASSNAESDLLEIPGAGRIWCFRAELPLRSERGLLIA